MSDAEKEEDGRLAEQLALRDGKLAPDDAVAGLARPANGDALDIDPRATIDLDMRQRARMASEALVGESPTTRSGD